MKISKVQFMIVFAIVLIFAMVMSYCTNVANAQSPSCGDGLDCYHTKTPTATLTPVPPTFTPTVTETPVPPTETLEPTDTPEPATSTPWIIIITATNVPTFAPTEKPVQNHFAFFPVIVHTLNFYPPYWYPKVP